MVVEYIRYKIAEGRAEPFLHAYEQAEQSLRASPHCLGFELSRCSEAPEHFILRIQWDSAAGHLQGFRQSHMPLLLPPAASRPVNGRDVTNDETPTPTPNNDLRSTRHRLALTSHTPKWIGRSAWRARPLPKSSPCWPLCRRRPGSEIAIESDGSRGMGRRHGAVQREVGRAAPRDEAGAIDGA